jgi:signal transduction histidine kinase
VETGPFDAKDGLVGLRLDREHFRSQLAAVLPVSIAADEAYRLRLEGDTLSVLSSHRGYDVEISEAPLSDVPVSDTILPGWSVQGSWTGLGKSFAPGGGFLWGGISVLVLLVGAILLGGRMLLGEARRSEREAQQQASFVANVSHEFKTPLTSIRLYSELLEQDRVAQPERRREYLGTIGRETARLTRLVNNVLDFGKLEQGKKRFETESFDLVHEVRQLVQTHAPRVESAGLALAVQVPNDAGVVVQADRDAVQQIVLNLIDNACKYAREGREVLVRVAASEGRATPVALVVADRGPGIPGDQKERIFAKFTRLDDSLTAEQTGTGLGLSIARQLARGMGGELSCRDRQGGGSEFRLLLPATPKTNEPV